MKTEKPREERITNEILVDAYNEDERAMGWYCDLEGKLRFPFVAQCIAKRAISPLKVKDEVEALGMAPEDQCGRDMFVMIRWENVTIHGPEVTRVQRDAGCER